MRIRGVKRKHNDKNWAILGQVFGCVKGLGIHNFLVYLRDTKKGYFYDFVEFNIETGKLKIGCDSRLLYTYGNTKGTITRGCADRIFRHDLLEMRGIKKIPNDLAGAVKIIEADYAKYTPRSRKVVMARRKRDREQGLENLRISAETMAKEKGVWQ